MSTSEVLLADIGGTNVRFALVDADHCTLRTEQIGLFDVVAFPTLIDAMGHYLGVTGAHARAAVLAVAGRVDNGEARMTNHRWTVSLPQVRQALGSDNVMIVNDFAAQARSIGLLKTGDLMAVGEPSGAPSDGEDGVRVVIGAGTGLGVGAAMTRSGKTHVLETEAGHVGFAPATADDRRLLELLAGKFDRVSNERLISGPGLLNLHDAMAPAGATTMTEPAEIARRAADGDPLCGRVLDTFFGLFGQIAGDLVLAHGAWRGVYLTGGIVPRLLPWLLRSRFRERFEHKGRFSEAMRGVPVFAVTHPHPGLLGAAGLARDMLQNPS